MDADRIIAEARKWIGTPYVHQASKRGAGCDCLGLLRGVWRSLYGNEPETVPNYTAEWDLIDREDVLLKAAHRHLVPVNEMPFGEIVRGRVIIFRWKPQLPAKHLAICAGTNSIIHAYERCGVTETALGSPWRRRIAGVFAFPVISPNQASVRE